MMRCRLIEYGLTNVLGSTLVKVMAWYDKEMGFSHRRLDLTVQVGRHLD